MLGTEDNTYSPERRLRSIRNYCREQDPQETVLFTDCFDVLMLSDMAEVESAYLSLESPLVFSAERNCWPDPILYRFPASHTSFRSLCAGTYIGRASHILRMMDEIDVDCLPRINSDQRVVTQWYLSHLDVATLDRECRIFQCYFESGDVVKFRKGRAFNTETATFPPIFHANGNHHDRDIERCFSDLFHESV